MKYKLTILNTAAFVFILGCIIYTLWNFSSLKNGEGLGIAGMLALMVFGLSALIIDGIIKAIFTNPRRQNIAGICILAIYVFLFYHRSW